MRNCDKYSKEEIITAAGDFRNPAVANGKLTTCVKINCDACDLNKIRENCKDCGQAFIVWLYSEADPEKEEDKNDQNKEIEDLKKAIWYINRSIEQINKEENNE